MPCRHRVALRRDSAVLPGLQHVIHPMERPLLRPEDKQRRLNFLVQVRLVVRQIDGRRRAVILANRMNRGWFMKRADIFLKYSRRRSSPAAGP